MNSRRQTWTVAVAVGLYAVAFLLPAAYPFADGKFSRLYGSWVDFRIDGAGAFHLGWNALTAVGDWDLERAPLAAAWLANPAFWVALGCALLGRERASALAAAVGVALGLAVLPRYSAVVVGQPGYWLWLASMAVLAAAPAITLLRRRPSESGQPNGPPLSASQAITSLRRPGG
jgi:hypothetical protein